TRWPGSRPTWARTAGRRPRVGPSRASRASARSAARSGNPRPRLSFPSAHACSPRRDPPVGGWCARERPLPHCTHGRTPLHSAHGQTESAALVEQRKGQRVGAARPPRAGGLRARVSCIDPKKLRADFVGREFDLEFLCDLPSGVDPCGENGEFHTFAYAGPMFHHAIAITPGEVVERDGFVFADLMPAR